MVWREGEKYDLQLADRVSGSGMARYSGATMAGCERHAGVC